MPRVERWVLAWSVFSSAQWPSLSVSYRSNRRLSTKSLSFFLNSIGLEPLSRFVIWYCFQEAPFSVESGYCFMKNLHGTSGTQTGAEELNCVSKTFRVISSFFFTVNDSLFPSDLWSDWRILQRCHCCVLKPMSQTVCVKAGVNLNTSCRVVSAVGEAFL